MKEFELIERYLKYRGNQRKDVAIGIGDDAAVVDIPEGMQLVVTTDTLVSGVHFFPDCDPRALGHKAVAVNLSDLSAMGAEPGWLSVALTLPSIDEQWIQDFSQGLFEISEYYNAQVIGGDTTQGPLSVTVSAKGLVPKDKALLRSNAKPGDWVFVSGYIGDAGLALGYRNQQFDIPMKHQNYILSRLDYPTPRVAAGQAIRNFASSAIDLSDGLISDIQHILRASEVGAQIDVGKLPLSTALLDSVSIEDAYRLALGSGDDYELLFTVPEDKRGAMEVSLTQYGVDATCIGQIRGGSSLELVKDDVPYIANLTGFEHFSRS
ncbi:thiamine-phosphate kinase [Algicola sagamiensis]|uniref:thiamine-phosphate kinase n=1 Tax=Algicola sagamiensis TaxID=163869 RepID=UPI0003777284|nr:thiamine-phosphate kinase [Algicola sagamiensis]